MAIIEIQDLKYRYPKTSELALKGVSLSINKGEFIGIIGQNGAGKSTLSQAIIGLVPQFYKGAYGGSVTVCGLPADKTPVSELCEHVGLIFQNPFNQLSGAKDTVYEEVAYGLQNLGVEREQMHARVEKVLKQLDIYQYRNRNPFDLSGGQMQRVAIASILVMQPDIIILDEPTSQLDPQGSEEVFKVVDQLTQMGITIIMIEQKLEKMAKYCSRIALMHDGLLVDFDRPEVIFSRDDLEELGIQIPAFSKVAKDNQLKNEDGTYPATLESTIALYQQSLKNYIALPQRELPVKQDLPEIFKVEDLSFSYTNEATIFEHLDLKLTQQSTAIIGQNGAGKTTIVRLLKGLLKPVSGKIYFGKEDISNKTVALLADKVGYVFQNPDDQIFKYNVLDEVMFGPLNIGMSKEEAKKQALAALELMGLSNKEEMNPYDLELYDRKMVAIASVVAMNTDVVILDEPTIAQDYKGKKKIGHMIETLSNQGKLVIAILHDMDFVYDYFDHVIVMAHGNILCEGNVEEVFAKDAELEEAKLQKPSTIQIKDILMKQK